MVSIIIFFGFNRLSDVDLNSRNRAFLASITLLLLFAIVFLFSFSISRKLRVIRAKSWFRGLNFRFFFLKVFYYVYLCTSFDRNSVGWLEVLKTVLVHVLNSGSRPEVSLDFGNNCFLHYLDKTFQFVILVL